MDRFLRAMQIIAVISLFFCNLLIMSIIVMKSFGLCCCLLPDALTSIPVNIYIATLISLCSVEIVWTEYNYKLKRDKATILSKYNDRFCADEKLRMVEEYLSKYIDLKQNKEGVTKDEVNKLKAEIEEYKEMYMRFFEELQYLIKSGVLDKKMTHDLFGYYANVVAEMKKEFVSDYDDNCWKTFRKFVNYK